MKSDLIAETIGEFGRWQKLLAFLVGLYGMVAAIVSIDTVFIAALPASWCHVPRPPAAAHLSPAQWRNLTVPWEMYQGKWRHHPCLVYGANRTALLDGQAVMDPGAVPGGAAVTNPQDVTDPQGVTDPQAVSDVGGRTYMPLYNTSRSDNSSLLQCSDFEFDNTTFQSTIITEVGSLSIK